MFLNKASLFHLNNNPEPVLSPKTLPRARARARAPART